MSSITWVYLKIRYLEIQSCTIILSIKRLFWGIPIFRHSHFRDIPSGGPTRALLPGIGVDDGQGFFAEDIPFLMM
jgi:hypothetical protein